VKTYLTAHEAASYLKCSYRAFDHWVRRNGVPCLRRGRIRLYDVRVLDDVVRTMAQRPALRKASGF
jgi:excisionase family DNA binding protein